MCTVPEGSCKILNPRYQGLLAALLCCIRTPQYLVGREVPITTAPSDQQCDDPTTTPAGNMLAEGLGLTICKGLLVHKAKHMMDCTCHGRHETYL